tara:strand:- start:215 stop:343 length:129 start_codon:yes stop_codon:yes gene_type:complete
LKNPIYLKSPIDLKIKIDEITHPTYIEIQLGNSIEIKLLIKK